ncbi:DUF5672 family protein [Mitsuokella sp.]|uniref:DUF5672 family protein n=1 Tax=Mitsuokella sp. TaxID=2049034 RepID=UPI003D7E1D6A
MKAAIVIPLYKSWNNLTDTEQASLQRAIEIFPKYDIYFIMADSFVMNYPIIYQSIPRRRFSNRYFRGTDGYSELLLNSNFYVAFLQYDYMLIYQLDAWAFSDRLAEFMDMGYDYIGAVCEDFPWIEAGIHVGNGGFSLRRVSSCRKVTLLKNIVFDRFPQYREECCRIEDFFFGLCYMIPELRFKVADENIARKFSMQYGVREITDELPFGCHAFDKFDTTEWYTLFHRLYGNKYAVESLKRKKYIDSARLVRLSKQILYLEKNGLQDNKYLQHFIAGREVSLWGYGDYGKRIYRILRRIGIPVEYIYDRRYNSHETDFFKYPAREKIREDNNVIFITTMKDSEISAVLNHINKKEGRDFLRIDDLIRLLSSDFECGNFR